MQGVRGSVPYKWSFGGCGALDIAVHHMRFALAQRSYVLCSRDCSTSPALLIPITPSRPLLKVPPAAVRMGQVHGAWALPPLIVGEPPTFDVRIIGPGV